MHFYCLVRGPAQRRAAADRQHITTQAAARGAYKRARSIRSKAYGDLKATRSPYGRL